MLNLTQGFFKFIQEKLVGKAEIVVGNMVELNDWASFDRALIIQCFL